MSIPILVLLSAPLWAGRSPDDLFHSALVKETAERNLDAAISLYQQTIGHPDVGPGVAGEARLRMGQCYEKLGQPRPAETVYRQLLSKTAGVSPEVVRRARTRFHEVEAENRLGVVLVAGSSTTIVWVRREQPTPLSLLLGLSAATGPDAMPAYGVTAGARWRLCPANRPLRYYAEVRGTAPVIRSRAQNLSGSSNALGPTTASLDLSSQISFAWVNEIPHGTQRVWIPEVGAGVARTAGRIRFSNAGVSGTQDETRWTPYLETGIQVFPEHALSMVIHVAYLPAPYLGSIPINGHESSSAFHFTPSQWVFGAMLQWRIGTKVSVPEIR